MGKIYLCSSSQLKTHVVENLCRIISDIKKCKMVVENIVLPGTGTRLTSMLAQPINEGTALACFTRIQDTVDHLVENKITLTGQDKVIGLENGIYQVNETGNHYDVCVMMIYDAGTETIDRYNSFGIQIDKNLFNMYRDPVYNAKNKLLDARHRTMVRQDEDDSPGHPLSGQYKKVVFANDPDILGYTDTFGNFLKNIFAVQPDNWMVDPRFGSVDRRVQMKDCCDKYLVNMVTTVIANYPEQGIMFRHVTPCLIDPISFGIIHDLLERIVASNFNIEQIDYFAGLDARGFYFAPVLARVFGKGFIPVRKALKLPGSHALIGMEPCNEYLDLSLTDDFGSESQDQDWARRSDGKMKNVLILDDLLATGASLVAGASVLRKAGLRVMGAVTVYDVPGLRERAKNKLRDTGICYRVLVNENNQPNDFNPSGYEIPEIVLKRIHATRDHPDQDAGILAKSLYTVTTEQWIDSNTWNHQEVLKRDMDKMKTFKVIYTEKERELATQVIDILATQTGAVVDPAELCTDVTSGLFSNGETHVKLNTSVRGMHVIIICQTRTGYINQDIMELLMIMDACTRAGAAKISVVLPYYPYARSDKKDDPRCPIGAAIIANLLKSMHIDNLISIDLHAGQIQGYVDQGFHNLYIRNYMCEFIHKNYLRFHEPADWNRYFILIAPDSGSAKAIKSYSKILGINNIILDKQRDYSKPGTVIASRFIGSREDFKGKTGLLIDDMADTMGTMCAAAQELVLNGLKDVVVLVTHGVLSGPAIHRINDTACIKEVVVTDTLPQDKNIIQSPKIRVVSCAELIARTIDGILTGRSISRLFG
jgi:ribose-phosphate pyrophosphokinase